MSRLNVLGEEDGLGLIELFVTMVIFSIAASIAAGTVVHAMKVQRRQVAEVDTLADTRIAMERITREVRAANPLLLAEANRLQVQVTRGDRQIQTLYELVGDRIDVSVTVTDIPTGTVTNVPARTLLRDVQMDPGEDIFTYTTVAGATGVPAPGADLLEIAEVGVALRLPLPESSRTVHLADGVTVRNAPVL